MAVPKRIYIIIRTETLTLTSPSYEIKRVHIEPELNDDPPSPGKESERFLVTSQQSEGAVRVRIEHNIGAPRPIVFEWHASKLRANLVALHERNRIEIVAIRWKKLTKTFVTHRDDGGRFYITEAKSEETDDDGNRIVNSGKTVWFEVVRVEVDDTESAETGLAGSEETETTQGTEAEESGNE